VDFRGSAPEVGLRLPNLLLRNYYDLKPIAKCEKTNVFNTVSAQRSINFIPAEAESDFHGEILHAGVVKSKDGRTY